MDESSTDETEFCRNVASGRRAAGAIRSLVNARELQLECTRVWHEKMLAPVLMYGSETMLKKEKGRSRIMVAQMDNLRGLNRYYEARQSPECTDKGVVWSDEGGRRKD